MAGWVKLSRGINNWGWKTDPNVVALWVHLLANANFENGYYLGYEIPAGSLPAGIPTLSLKTGLSSSQIRTAIKKLKMTGEIAVRITPKFSIITIVKWSEYQGNDRQDDSRIAGQSQADDNTIRRKEYKNVKKEYTPPEGVSLSVWEDFEKLRKTKKAPITETAINGIKREAEKAGWTLEQALSECCARGWQSFKAEYVKQKGKQNAKRTSHDELREYLDESRNGIIEYDVNGNL